MSTWRELSGEVTLPWAVWPFTRCWARIPKNPEHRRGRCELLRGHCARENHAVDNGMTVIRWS